MLTKGLGFAISLLVQARRMEQSPSMKQHIILGQDISDAEALRDQWLSENPAIKVLRVHRPRLEPESWLTLLGGHNIPRVSITIEYE